MDPRGKGKGKWIQGEREKESGFKEKGKRCVDPRGKKKGEYIQGEREKVSGSKEKEKR